MTRRLFLRHAVIAAGGIVAAACQPSAQPTQAPAGGATTQPAEATPAPQGAVEIVYYDRTTSAPAWADAYNASQDKVKVTVQIQPPNTRYEQLVAQITAGNAPDVIGLDCVQVGRFAQLSALVPLGDLVSKEVLDLYFPQLVTTPHHFGIFGDKLLGLPFWLDLSVLFYNKALLEQAGGDPEAGIRSWDDYVTYGKKVTQGDVVGFSIAQCLSSGFIGLPWIWAQGVDIFNKDFTKSTINTPEVIATLQFLRDLVNVHKITNDALGTDWNTMTSIFTGGKALIVHQGGGLVGLARKEFPDLWKVLGTCPIPGPKVGQKSSMIGGNVAAMSTQCKKQQEALDFIIWATSSQEGMAVTGEVGYLPGCPAGLDLPVFKNDWNVYATFRDALEFGYPVWNHPRNDEFGSPRSDAFCAAVRGERPIEEIAAEWERRTDEIIQRK
jgi:multiple sugar transport system substrate-binding protein